MVRQSPPYDPFIEEGKIAVAQARQDLLAAGIPIVYVDEEDPTVQEHPGGGIFEIRFRPGVPGDGHVEIIRELTNSRIGRAAVLDNRRTKPVGLFGLTDGRISWRANRLPQWAEKIAGQLE
jgi:hypothetical protein